jgi:hypothetical protein
MSVLAQAVSLQAPLLNLLAAGDLPGSNSKPPAMPIHSSGLGLKRPR